MRHLRHSDDNAAEADGVSGKGIGGASETGRKDARKRFAAALIGLHERVARLSVAFGIMGDATAAGDVVQDAFIRAWDRLADLREPERFATWLCGIVRNLAVDYLRRRKPAETLGDHKSPHRREVDARDPLTELD